MNYLQPDWPAPAHVKAYTTLRTSWGGAAPKSIEERRRLQALLALPEDPIWLNQTHSTIVLPATPAHRDQIADASFAHQRNQVCAILTADCLPILLCNKKGTHIAAIHAGWRGLANGIIENTLDALAEPTADLMAWLGPAIGPQKFEVGDDVYNAFVRTDPLSATAFSPLSQEKWHVDLYALAIMRLTRRGVTHIYGGNFCTYTQEDLFFSYRRDQNQAGRMASLIWLVDDTIQIDSRQQKMNHSEE